MIVEPRQTDKKLDLTNESFPITISAMTDCLINFYDEYRAVPAAIILTKQQLLRINDIYTRTELDEPLKLDFRGIQLELPEKSK